MLLWILTVSCHYSKYNISTFLFVNRASRESPQLRCRAAAGREPWCKRGRCCDRQGSSPWSFRSRGAATRRRRKSRARPISVLRFWISEGLTEADYWFLRCGVLMSIGIFPESSSRAILAGIILVGRWGVAWSLRSFPSFSFMPACWLADHPSPWMPSRSRLVSELHK